MTVSEAGLACATDWSVDGVILSRIQIEPFLYPRFNFLSESLNGAVATDSMSSRACVSKKYEWSTLIAVAADAEEGRKKENKKTESTKKYRAQKNLVIKRIASGRYAVNEVFIKLFAWVESYCEFLWRFQSIHACSLFIFLTANKFTTQELSSLTNAWTLKIARPCKTT